MDWSEMMKFVPTLLISAILIYGGICDYKRREIPNAVPISVILVGLFDISPLAGIIGLAATAATLLLAEKLMKSEIPGGDFKLLCALGFSCGLSKLVIAVAFAGVGAAIIGLIKHLHIKRHIPLCSYLAPSYIALQIILFSARGVIKV